MIWQYIIIAIAVITCIGYAGYRIYRSLRDKDGNPACAGCPLKKQCTRKEECGKEHI